MLHWAFCHSSNDHCKKLSICHSISFSLFQLKSLTVGVEDSARECIRSALRALDLSPASALLLPAPPDENDASAANVNSSSLLAGNSNSNSNSSNINSNNNNAGYQLWVRTKLDESPYPLIGHEVTNSWSRNVTYTVHRTLNLISKGRTIFLPRPVPN